MDTAQIALILVDIQRDFWRPLEGIAQFQSLPGNVRTLLRVARENGLLVVHTHSGFQADGSDWMLFYGPNGRGRIPCIANTDGVAVEGFAEPLAAEPVIRKQTFDGFMNTGLEKLLHSRSIRAVLLAGLDTSVCVLFTATSAYQRRFAPIVVSDACADAPDRHEAALRMYSGLCFQSITTAQVQNDLTSVVRLAEPYVLGT